MEEDNKTQTPFELKIDEYDKDRDYPHYAVTHERSGFNITKKDTSKEVSSIKIFAKILMKVLKGGLKMDEITLPAVMLHPESIIELYLYGFNYVASYLEEAAKIEDPLERVKIAFSGVIANLPYANMRSNGNPPIPSRMGETIQGKLPSGVTAHVEQLGSGLGDHTVLIYGTDDSFRIQGRFDVKKFF